MVFSCRVCTAQGEDLSCVLSFFANIFFSDVQFAAVFRWDKDSEAAYPVCREVTDENPSMVVSCAVMGCQLFEWRGNDHCPYGLSGTLLEFQLRCIMPPSLEQGRVLTTNQDFCMYCNSLLL